MLIVQVSLANGTSARCLENPIVPYRTHCAWALTSLDLATVGKDFNCILLYIGTIRTLSVRFLVFPFMLAQPLFILQLPSYFTSDIYHRTPPHPHHPHRLRARRHAR